MTAAPFGREGVTSGWTHRLRSRNRCRSAGDRGGSATRRGSAACADVELHVVSIHDPYSSKLDTLGPAHVHVDRPGSMVLFLSAVSATDWTVTAGPDTKILAVIANGHEKQTVIAPENVIAVTTSYENGDVFVQCDEEWMREHPVEGCEAPGLIAAIEAETRLPVSSFHGCYAASEIAIGADLSSTSDCATDEGYTHTNIVTQCSGAPPSSTACAGKGGTGKYEGFICDPTLYPDGGPFIITADSSCVAAVVNCQLNAALNPGSSLVCAWNDDEVLLLEDSPGACDGIGP